MSSPSVPSTTERRSADGPVSLFAAADGTRRAGLRGHAHGTNCLAWQPVARPPAGSADFQLSVLSSQLVLATGGQDGAVKLRDAAAGQHTATATLGTARVEKW